VTQDVPFAGVAWMDSDSFHIEGTVRYPDRFSVGTFVPRPVADGDTAFEFDLQFNRDKEPYCDAELIGKAVFHRCDVTVPDTVDWIRVYLSDEHVEKMSLERRSETITKVKCRRCKALLSVPNLAPEDAATVASLRQDNHAVMAMDWLVKNAGSDIKGAKAIVLHIPRVADSCHRCDSKLLERGVVSCSKCRSINVNWLGLSSEGAE